MWVTRRANRHREWMWMAQQEDMMRRRRRRNWKAKKMQNYLWFTFIDFTWGIAFVVDEYNSLSISWYFHKVPCWWNMIMTNFGDCLHTCDHHHRWWIKEYYHHIFDALSWCNGGCHSSSYLVKWMTIELIVSLWCCLLASVYSETENTSILLDCGPVSCGIFMSY